MNRLVVVSNRVALPSKQGTSGGLAVALGEALQEAGGLWFGWSGKTTEGPPGEPSAYARDGVRYVTTDISVQDHEEYYLGFSNSVIWPSFHFRLDLADFERTFFEGYRRVNARFAEHLALELTGSEMIWVHDYQLIPLGAELRERGCEQPMGFFLHIPWPPRQIVTAVPGHEWLARSLFAYDLIGFQTKADRRNFIRYVVEELGGKRLDDSFLELRGRKVMVKIFPIGIDVPGFQAMADGRESTTTMKRMRHRNIANTQIIGADRLDYSKGLPNRFRAFQHLLQEIEGEEKEKWRKLCGKVTLMQIAAPTREGVDVYDALRHELEQLSGEINGAFGEFDWTPVRYINRNMPRTTISGLFRVSRIGLVTPFRDGMNLVAKEYVAAQDAEDPGVLVLSRFAGAAETLRDALVVNPYDIEQMADALKTALAMPLDERQARHQALMEDVERNDIFAWRRSFLDCLTQMAEARGT
ncbi:MAG: trehalose-6-phosphate synthase [Pseudomonadota bacterium]